MFTVRCGAIKDISTTFMLHDNDPYGDCVIVNGNLHTVINGAGDLSFTILPNHPNYNRVIKRLFTFVDVLEDDEVIWRGRVTDVKTDIYAQKTVSCEGCLSFLSDTLQRPKKYNKATLRTFLNDVIARHNADVTHQAKKITLGTVADVTSIRVSGVTNYETTLETISNFVISKYGGIIELEPNDNGLILNYTKEFTKTSTQKIEFGENLMDFVIESDSNDVYTAVIPLGAVPEDAPEDDLDHRITIASVNGGKDYLYSRNPNITLDYGWIFQTIENSDIDDPMELFSWGMDYVDSLEWEKIVLQVTALDLSLISNVKSLKLGQKVNVVSKPHNIDYTLPVTEMTQSITTVEPTKYTIGQKAEIKLSGLMR